LLVLGLLSSECCQEAAALAVGGVAARGLPVRSSDLDGVRNLLRSRIEVSKAALRKEMSEADFCRTELDGARSKLETQSKVVEEKLRALKALGAKGTGHEEIDGEMAVKRARQSLKASAPEGEQQASSFAAVSSRAATGAAGAATLRSQAATVAATAVAMAATPSEGEVAEAKYQLKKEMGSLANVNREHDILRDRCMVNAGQEMTYEQRKYLRNAEIKSLNKAHKLLDDCGFRCGR